MPDLKEPPKKAKHIRKKVGNVYTFFVLIAIVTVVTVTHEAAHYIVAKKHGVKILEASYGFGPRIYTYNANGTDYSLSAIPMGGYVSMEGEQDMPTPIRSAKATRFNAQPDPVQLSILLAGPLVNILTGSILILILRPPTRKKQGTKIAEVLPGSPADKAGLTAKERITAINTIAVNTANDIHKTLQGLPAEQPISLLVEKAGIARQITLQPQQRKGLSPALFPIMVPQLGIRLSREMIKTRNAITATPKDIIHPLIVLVALPLSLTLAIIKRHIRLSDIVIGPIGLFFMVKSLISSGKATAMELFAMISLSVGFTNALPIPILDGGRAAIIITEKAMHTNLSETAAHTTNFTGAMVLLTLLVFTIYTDISKIRRGKRQGTDLFDIATEPLI